MNVFGRAELTTGRANGFGRYAACACEVPRSERNALLWYSFGQDRMADVLVGSQHLATHVTGAASLMK